MIPPANLEIIKRKALATSGADPAESDYSLMSRYNQIQSQFNTYWENNTLDQAYASGIRLTALYKLLSSRHIFKDKESRQKEFHLVMLKLQDIEQRSMYQYTAQTLESKNGPSKNESPSLLMYPHLDVSKQSGAPLSIDVSKQSGAPLSIDVSKQLPTISPPARSLQQTIQYPSFTEIKGPFLKRESSHLLASQHSSSPSAPTLSSHVPDLRRMVVPLSLISTFLKLSSQNTSNGIETCGILGAISQNGFLVVNILVIPKQRGTSDNTEMINEEDLVQIFGGKRGIIQAGWIHTHPTQGCFLSSIDIHTQLSFQTQLAEAIAIVLDPQLNTYQVFRLTDERTVMQGRRGCNGIAALTRCTDRGFHQQHDGKETQLCYEISEEEVESFTHQVPGMYHTCDSSKHVLIDESLQTTVYDLR
jgi:proteasome lid subunit RPN8/RPN11